MATAVLEKEDTVEPLLAGDLNERFYRAVHDAPPLFYDVIQTGFADKNLRQENGFAVYDEKQPYEIVLLHGSNINDALLQKMMALQDKAARHREPHPENAIDYKTEEEIISHYSGQGLGLAVFTAGGELIGQTMLSFKQPVTGPFAMEGEESQANIDWLMVDREYGRNFLCESLIKIAIRMAEASGMSEVRAHVRLHNEKALTRFTAAGFVVAGTGSNQKDGSTVLRAFRPLKSSPDAEENFGLTMRLDSLQNPGWLAVFESMLEGGSVAKWDSRAKWFTFHSPYPKVKPGAPGLDL